MSDVIQPNIAKAGKLLCVDSTRPMRRGRCAVLLQAVGRTQCRCRRLRAGRRRGQGMAAGRVMHNV